jgi:radical SAM protein with 4Fe4S-binding SPASM domain
VNFITDEARDFDIKEMAHDPEYVCPTPWQRMSIAYNGKVHQCITDYAGTLIIGDANVQSLLEIWQGEGFKVLRKRFREHTALDNCDACHYCSDNVPTEGRTIKVGDRLIKASKYKEIIDVVDETKKIQRNPHTRLNSEYKKVNDE